MADELLKRLIISENDLLQTREYLGYILRNDLHESNDSETKLVLMAFNTALIVSYSRPFKKNFLGKISPASQSLLFPVGDLLNEEEQKVHARVIRMRDTEHAHSDADSHAVDISRFDDSIISISRNPFIALSKADLSLLEVIVGKILDWIISEKQHSA